MKSRTYLNLKVINLNTKENVVFLKNLPKFRINIYPVPVFGMVMPPKVDTYSPSFFSLAIWTIWTKHVIRHRHRGTGKLKSG